MYNKQEISDYFEKGKQSLNTGRYEFAIEIYSKIVATTAPYSNSDPDAYTTWNTALTNLGHARCLKGYPEGNRELVELGLADFNRVIATAPNKEQQNRMAANARLNEWTEKLKDWKN